MIMKKKDYPKGKLHRSSIKEGILRADGWSSECPYRQTVAIEGITFDHTADILLDDGMALGEEVAFQRALIVSEMQGMNSITVKAYGMKPSIDLHFLVAAEVMEEQCQAGA